jgi:uncharacterized protein YukE
VASKNLGKIGKRGGTELQSMLEGMGEEGYALVNSLAGASDKQFKSIVAKLKKTGDLAKATLADFTKQLNAITKESQQFAADLQKLAAAGSAISPRPSPPRATPAPWSSPTRRRAAAGRQRPTRPSTRRRTP